MGVLGELEPVRCMCCLHHFGEGLAGAGLVVRGGRQRLAHPQVEGMVSGCREAGGRERGFLARQGEHG